MGGDGRSVGFTTVPAGCLDLPSEPACSTSGRLSFALGGLRGGGGPSLRGLPTSTASRRQAPQPVLELARAAEDRADVLERGYRIVKVAGDGRCLFRAIAKGLAHNQGGHVAGVREKEAADELRLAVHDALCRSSERSKQFEEVNFTVENLEGGRSNYCRKLQREDFWGGELEILVLSKMLRVPIYVYCTAEEAGVGGYGYAPIAMYGEQFERRGGKGAKGRRAVRVLYSHGNHYDALF